MSFCSPTNADGAQVEVVATGPDADGVQGAELPLVCAVNHGVDRERDGRTTVVVMQPFGYRHEASGRTIWVPASYVTDFASIPRVGRWLIPPFGRHAIAAVVHDWLYSVGEPGRRGHADDVFREALDTLGVDVARRNIMHAAVRSFGEGGYARAAEMWPRSFMDWRTGALLPPPAPREAFFGDGDPDVLAAVKAQRPVNCG